MAADSAITGRSEMSQDEGQLDIAALRSITFTRVLSESTLTGSIYLLGTIQGSDAIIHLQRTALPTERAADVVRSDLEELNIIIENKPYFSAHGYLTPHALPDLTVKVIWPATEVHIRKYSQQERFLLRETPETYEKVVVPYIESFPPERISWVYNILEGRKEAERVLFKDDDPELGFLILPDLKWDQSSMSSLYLTVLVQTREIRCLRDLKVEHLPLLRKIRDQARSTAREKFDVGEGKLRLFVHYQPSYYHFHVHVVHVDHEAMAGMVCGQAHLLDDLISLLELSPPSPEKSLIARMTLTYSLGVEHGLFPGLKAAQASA